MRINTLLVILTISVGFIAANETETGGFLLQKHNNILVAHERTLLLIDEQFNLIAEHLDLKECLQGKLKGCVDGFKESISKLSKDDQQKKAGALLGELKDFLDYLKTTKPGSIADIEKWINGQGYNNKDNKVFWNCVISSFKSCSAAEFFELHNTISMITAEHNDLKECLQGKLKGCVDGFKESISKLSKDDQQQKAGVLLEELKAFLEYLKTSKPESVADIEKWVNGKGYNNQDNKVFWNCVIASFKSCAGGLFDLSEFEYTVSMISAEHKDLKECLQGKLKGCVDGFKESISKLSKEDQQQKAGALLGELKNFLDYLKASKPESIADIEKWINGKGYNTADNKVFWNCTISAFQSCTA